jgi:hypothetical protein
MKTNNPSADSPLIFKIGNVLGGTVPVLNIVCGVRNQFLLNIRIMCEIKNYKQVRKLYCPFGNTMQK